MDVRVSNRLCEALNAENESFKNEVTGVERINQAQRHGSLRDERSSAAYDPG